MRSDDRLHEAQAIPIDEVATRLGLTLRRISAVEKCGPCPACGGTDRFSINTQKQVYNCRSCGGGDGIKLVTVALGCDFPQALDFLVGAADVEIDPAEKERRRKKREADEQRQAEYAAKARAKAIEDARAIWASAEGCDLEPVRAYLDGRGIRFASWPPTLRCLPAHRYVRKLGGQYQEYHRGPAMIAAVQAPNRSICAVHQTWIDPARPGSKAEILDGDGAALPAKLVRGSKKGGAIRLGPQPPAGGCLVVGEGIETTASAMVVAPIEGASYWAGVDLGNMAGRQIKRPGKRYSGEPDLEDLEAFLPPPDLGRLIFLQDGDSDPKATRAKLEAGLRRAMAHNPQLRAEIVAAPEGKDFNDVLKGDHDDDTEQ